MKVEVNEKFPITISDLGTVMDYVDHEFIFIIKDEFYTDYEIKGFMQKELVLEYVNIYDISLFLITVEDVFDTSDFIYNIHESDDHTLFDEDCLNASIYLLDKNDMVIAKKSFTMNKEMSQCVQTKLSIALNSPYNPQEYECNLEGIMNTWEPFELSDKAICKMMVK